MKMTELLRYDIPPEIIRLWQEQESERLLPLQETAIKRYGLFGDRNLLIQAPTTSGKTFIGEMAAIQTALRRRKAVYLAPLKALAEEKWRDFAEKYTEYGLKVIISTRDHREYDQALEGGDFTLAVAVYEKLSQLLVRRPERIQEIDLVIADELEILSDPERGGMVEVLLTRLLQMGVRVIGLSAVLGEPGPLATWMNADLVETEQRPVELRYGVIHDGVFRYRTYDTRDDGEEPAVACPSDSPWQILTENLTAYVARDEPCLIFVKDKHESRRGASLLAERLDLPPATAAIEALRGLEPTHSRDMLLDVLNQGVAFHNADLSPAERRIVEDGCRSEEIRVLVSTSTLAAGMNLPMQNVFISTDKWQYDTRYGMPWRTPILRSEFENMGGRAGRYGAGKAFGRSILIAPTPFDNETLWRRYIDGEREPIEPRLIRHALENHVLRLVASASCRNHDELLTFFERTLTGQWFWDHALSREEREAHMRAAINRLIDVGMAAWQDANRVEATPLGHATAAKGITIDTACELMQWLRESESRPWIPLDLILAVAVCPDGRLMPIPLTGREYDEVDYADTMRRITASEDIVPNVPMNRIRNCNLTPFYDEVRSIKAALFLCDWIDETPPYAIEEQYHVLYGQILATAEQISWLLDATAALAAASGAQQACVQRIETLAHRVARGLREDSLPLATVEGAGLERRTVCALGAEGLDRPTALAAASVKTLQRWMTAKQAKAVHAWAVCHAPSHEGESPAEPPTAEPVLVVDDKRPDRVRIDGHAVVLQDKQYRLLRALAKAPGECVPYEDVYQAIWGEVVVEPNQLHCQRRRLAERIEAIVPGRGSLVKTITKRGFMLDLAPADVNLVQAVSSAA